MKIDWWPPECLDRSHECVCRDSVVRPSPLDCFCVRPGTDEIGEGCRRGLFHPRSEILACSRGNPPRVKSCGRSRGKTLLIRVHLRRGEGRVSTLGLHVVLHNLIAQDLD